MAKAGAKKNNAQSQKKAKPNALPRWDLTDFYRSIDDPKIIKDTKKAQRLCREFSDAYSKSMQRLSAARFAKSLAEYEALEDLLGKLSCYAQLQYSTQKESAEVTSFYQNMMQLVSDCSQQLLFFTLGINQWAEKDLKAKLKNKDVAKYSPWLREVRSFKQYQLSNEIETLLHQKNITGAAAWNRLFDESIARLRFDYKGKELSEAEVMNLMSHKDGKVRKAAAESIANTFEVNAPVFTLITNTLAKDKEIEDSKRGFERPISSRNVANAVEDEVVEALLSTVQSRYKYLSHRYYKWKARQLGVKKMPFWDRNAPLPKADNTKWSWDTARELVLDAYGAFSPTLAKAGKQFFDKNWIDADVYAGKDSGAFSHPTVPSVHPYILMNFQGKTRDVMTLAHELGHGVHQVLSAKQGALMADTPLTLAETASVFGEMLTFQEILRREKSEQKRTYLIAAKVEDMLNTVVRQVAFCEFERQLHDARRKGELTTQAIGEIWMDVQRDSLGPAITLDKSYHVFWMYIPHFIHVPFYVYAYAFGDCLVNSLYAVYEKEAAAGKATSFEKKYIAMLSAGGTLRHKELLKPFGLNAAKPDFWKQGLSVIEGFIDQLG